MSHRTLPTFRNGDTIRVSDEFGVCGGGVVLDISFSFVEVAQAFTHRHNGVVIERDVRPMRYSLTTHTFEIV